ncbi:MAG TPA: hypothetical protein VH163_01250 [Gemmatimonadales bacterium]|nr:hypothetical protein [Gemmatimonadales bacterium]
MTRSTWRLALLIGGGILAAGPAAAERRAAYWSPSFGVHFGYNFDVNDPLVGAQATFPLGRYVAFYPTFDYYFTSGVSTWALNGDLKLYPGAYRVFYVASGINYTHVSVNGNGGGNTNLNLVAGLEGHRRFGAPYLEGRLILGNGSSFQIVGGLSWH